MLVMAVAVLLAVMTMVASGEVRTEVREMIRRQLTPERCASAGPYELYGQLVKEGKLEWGPEQQTDTFLEEYQVVLAKRTNESYPAAVKMREPLMKTFDAMVSFIWAADGGPRIHVRSRLPGELEWDLAHGYATNFKLGKAGRYTHEDLRELAGVFQRSRMRNSLRSGGPLGADAFEGVMDELKAAEKVMSKEAVMYFRGKLVVFLMGFLEEG